MCIREEGRAIGEGWKWGPEFSGGIYALHTEGLRFKPRHLQSGLGKTLLKSWKAAAI